MKNNFFIILLLTFISCSKKNFNNLAINQTTEQEILVEMPPKLFPNLVATKIVWNTALNELKTSNKSKAAFKNWIVSKTEEAIQITPYAVYNLDKINQPNVWVNVKTVYNLSIRWFFLDKECSEAKKYLKKITQLISQWAVINEPTRHTPVESILTPVYEAYSLVRSYMPSKDRNVIDNWIQKRANYYKNLEFTNVLKENNWSTIRINFLFYYALLLEDQNLYDYALNEFKNHIELNLFSDGKSHDLVKRDAFHYQGYNLLFYARIIKAVAMIKGQTEALNLYELTNSNGGSVSKSVSYWEPFLIDPEHNSHIEFVNTHWKPDKTSSDYMQVYDPNSALYVLDELRFIEPKCSNYMKIINESTLYNRNFRFWINSLNIN